MLAGCDKPKAPDVEINNESEESFFDSEPRVVDHVHHNRLKEEPSDFLRSRTDDRVHWQPWSSQVFEDAKSEQRLVFAVVGSGKFPGTFQLLDDLNGRHAAIADGLNQDYVCTFVDTETHPEIALQLGFLSTEIKPPVSFPAIAWFSHQADPVAWLPLSNQDVENFDRVFGNSEAMVSRIWADSSRYVIENSARDSASRLERSKMTPTKKHGSDELLELLQDSSRSLAALYDPTTEGIDGGGGLIPAGMLHFCGLAGQSPLIEERVRKSLQRLVRGMSGTLMRGAICDPLDGGVFAARRSAGWDIPQLLKLADTQSAVGRAFALNSNWAADPAFLDLAKGCLDYADQQFAEGGTSVGNYSVVSDPEVGERAFFLSDDKVRELLSEDEFKAAKLAYGLSGLGNVPFEADPRRDYFRKNTFSQRKSVAEVATALGESPEQTKALLESGRKILNTARQEMLEQADASFIEQCRITSINANYVTALAELARTTGEASYVTRAQAVLAYLKEHHYTKDAGWLRTPAAGGRRQVRARGQDYSTLLAAHFALYRVDLDPNHLVEAISIAEDARSALTDDEGLMRELPIGDRIGTMPIYSSAMLFGPSTWGTIYGPMERLVQLTGDELLAESADTLRAHLMTRAKAAAMVHTDFLAGALVPLTNLVVHLEGEPGTVEFDALHGLLLEPRFDAVTILHLADGLPETIKTAASGQTAATVYRGDAVAGKAATPEELELLLAPITP